MQSQLNPGASIPEPSSFAGFLSALASPAPASRADSWNDDALADDVATLSYESALKAHSRYKPAPDPVPVPRGQAAREPAPQAAESTLHQTPTAPSDHKTASITIRVSQAECAQLRQRAAEAGMTISAYLRSCTFEAEALRQQVKEALAQLRAAGPVESKQPAASIQASAQQTAKRDWLRRVFRRNES